MLHFSSITPSNHLTSIRVPNTDSPDQRFNSIENTQNGLQGIGVAGGVGGPRREYRMETARAPVSPGIMTMYWLQSE